MSEISIWALSDMGVSQINEGRYWPSGVNWLGGGLVHTAVPPPVIPGSVVQSPLLFFRLQPPVSRTTSNAPRAQARLMRPR